MDLSVEGFESAIAGRSKGSASIDTYIKQFEYNYVLMQEKGCFTGNDLTLADMMVDMGMGVKELGYFNKATLIGLYDIDALATVGTEAVDYGFVWKLALLAVIAIACYTVGSLKFQKKDLPL